MSSLHEIPAVCPGEKVCIIAPGMRFNTQELKSSTKVLKSWGLVVEQPKDLIGRHPVSASSEKTRWTHLRGALESDARIIWAARGGYGSLHLLKYFKTFKPKSEPKLLVGFSDITTLHQYINDKWGWSSFHGPHADRLHALSEARQKELREMIFGKRTDVRFSLKPLNAAAKKTKNLKSFIVGGNLVTTQSTFGTDWQLQTKNRILFLEDIGERGYRVDRVLEHMWALGMLQSAKAVVFGPFVGGEEPGGKKSKVPAVLKAFADRVKCPVYRGIDSGHIPNSRTLPLMTKAEISKTGPSYLLNVSTGIKS